MVYEILVFVQEGCPACHQLTPIAEKVCGHYGRCSIPWRFVDVHREPALADTMKITETPTIVGCANFYPEVRMIGADNAEPRLLGLYAQLFDRTGAPPNCPRWKGDV